MHYSKELLILLKDSTCTRCGGAYNIESVEPLGNRDFDVSIALCICKVCRRWGYFQINQHESGEYYLTQIEEDKNMHIEPGVIVAEFSISTGTGEKGAATYVKFAGSASEKVTDPKDPKSWDMLFQAVVGNVHRQMANFQGAK